MVSKKGPEGPIPDWPLESESTEVDESQLEGTVADDALWCAGVGWFGGSLVGVRQKYTLPVL